MLMLLVIEMQYMDIVILYGNQLFVHFTLWNIELNILHNIAYLIRLDISDNTEYLIQWAGQKHCCLHMVSTGRH